ncbi:ATP-dependent helicase [Desulfurococcaceae archaeon MEX13E-LK6-19]|nr:ATP-dependent helicase [Desulfurococcaceae archaeon MEX13E-LK6-19]
MTIKIVNDTHSDEEVYGMLRPYVREWFKRKYGTFTPPQRMAIPLIKAKNNVLISSPTGTGKTLAVFLAIIDDLYEYYEKHGSLPEGIQVVYVSPLRALNNDMRRNLLEPIKGIREVAKENGIELPEIKVAVRTSDTSPSEKQRMVRDPPHILITTPESLGIILNAPRFRERLKTTKYIVIDEIHELASSKRGSHLSLSVERLEELVGRPLIRIGLSATIAPLEEVAKFLVGFTDDGNPRPCMIVDARFTKPIDIKVLCPVKDLVHASAEEINNAIYETLIDLIKNHRTTLVFTNTRSATERVVYKLRKLMENLKIVDVDEIEAHHSSLSRELRLEIEEKLKRGELRVIVSSTSLELGIDIGYIDLVVLLSSPKSVSRLLQRIGRAGHHIREVSKGRIIVVDRDDLVECTVLAKAALERKIDKVRIPKNPLDVLAQHLVGMALEKKWRIDEAYRVIKRSYTFHTLSWEDYMNTLRYLAGKYMDYLEHMRVYAKIWLDEKEGVFGRKKGARMIYFLNIGTIPDESKARVFTIDGKYVGDLEEEFVEYLAPGDLFVLGGRVYEYLRSYGLRVIVKPADGAKPTVPSWFSEMLPLSFDSALEVGKFRRTIAEMIKTRPREDVIDYLVREYNLDRDAAENIYQYIWEQIMFANGLVPSDKLILIEIYDEGIRRNIIVHALFGRRVNAALSRAYAYIVGNHLGVNVRVTINDNGFMLTLPGRYDADWIGLFKELKSTNIDEILKKVLRKTEMLKRRFRHCAQRAFMILRRYRDVERSVQKLQLNAEELLRVVEEIPDFPVLKETYREILEDYMHIDAAKTVLDRVHNGEICLAQIGPSTIPSPFAHNIVVQGYSDIVLMEDRKKLLQKLHSQVMKYISMLRKY